MRGRSKIKVIPLHWPVVELAESVLLMFSELPVSQCKKGNMSDSCYKIHDTTREVTGPGSRDTLL